MVLALQRDNILFALYHLADTINQIAEQFEET
jgi:hypothetical protein